MLQSAIFSELQVPAFAPPARQARPVLTWALGSFAQIAEWIRLQSRVNEVDRLSNHLRRDIGLEP